MVSGVEVGADVIGRRSFLAGILGAAAAPAIVKAESLMKIIVPRQALYTGELGAIDGFRIVTSNTIAREMLQHAGPLLLMRRFSACLPMPPPDYPTIKFRRRAGPTFSESTILHDLLRGDRKTT